MDLFDDIFDFDLDGKADFTERVIGTTMVVRMLDDALEEERRSTWRQEHMLNMDDDSDPDDYDTEEEFLEAAESYAWKQSHAQDLYVGVDIDDYDTEDEYLEAVSQATWQQKYEDDTDIGVEPEEYDTEEEYLEAVEAAQWRRKYEYDCDIGVDPADYDTEEKYLDDLAYERECQTEDDDDRAHVRIPSLGTDRILPAAPSSAETSMNLTFRVCPIGKTWEEVDNENELVAARNQTLHSRLVVAHLHQQHPDIANLRQAIALYKKRMLSQNEPAFMDAFLVQRKHTSTNGNGLNVIQPGSKASVLLDWRDIAPKERCDILQECRKNSVGMRAIVRQDMMSDDGSLMCVEVYLQ